jgi:hypothetical protein
VIRDDSNDHKRSKRQHGRQEAVGKDPCRVVGQEQRQRRTDEERRRWEKGEQASAGDAKAAGHPWIIGKPKRGLTASALLVVADQTYARWPRVLSACRIVPVDEPQIRDAVAEYLWRLQTAQYAISHAHRDLAKVIGEDGVTSLIRANVPLAGFERRVGLGVLGPSAACHFSVG